VEAVAIVVSKAAETALDPDPMISFSDVWVYAEAVGQTAVAVVVLAVAVATAAVLHSSWLPCHRPADPKKTSLR
jgi:hypothetical protein